jgi:hypothetical protein
MKNFQEKKELIKLVMLKMMEEIMKNSEIYWKNSRFLQECWLLAQWVVIEVE